MSDKDNITLPREVAEKALDALHYAARPPAGDGLYAKEIAILRTHLAAPRPEPVAWMYVNSEGECEQIEYGTEAIDDDSITLLYAAPPDDVEALRRDAERLWEALKHYGKHDDDCGDYDAYNNESLRHCGCGLDAVLDETLGDKT